MIDWRLAIPSPPGADDPNIDVRGDCDGEDVARDSRDRAFSASYCMKLMTCLFLPTLLRLLPRMLELRLLRIIAPATDIEVGDVGCKVGNVPASVLVGGRAIASVSGETGDMRSSLDGVTGEMASMLSRDVGGRVGISILTIGRGSPSPSSSAAPNDLLNRGPGNSSDGETGVLSSWGTKSSSTIDGIVITVSRRRGPLDDSPDDLLLTDIATASFSSSWLFTAVVAESTVVGLRTSW